MALALIFEEIAAADNLGEGLDFFAAHVVEAECSRPPESKERMRTWQPRGPR